MSFFGGGGSGGFNDPFFGNMHQQMFRQMQEMDNLMSSMMGGGQMMDPFSMMNGGMGMNRRRLNPRQQMIEDNRASSSSNRPEQQQMVDERQRRRGGGPLAAFLNDDDMMMPFGRSMMGGGMFAGMMNQMENVRERAMNDPNSHVYSQSTVISYDGLGEEPKYYESTNSVRKAGNVKEERQTVRDTAKGVEQMKIRHQMGDKAHAIEKKRGRDGKIEENQEFQNLTESEAREFDGKFSEKIRRGGDSGVRQIERGPIIEEVDDDHPAAIDSSANYGQRRRTNDRRQQGPIIEEIDDDDVTARQESQSMADGSDRKRRRGLFGKKLVDG